MKLLIMSYIVILRISNVTNNTHNQIKHLIKLQFVKYNILRFEMVEGGGGNILITVVAYHSQI
jgi:hypothetical protein